MWMQVFLIWTHQSPWITACYPRMKVLSLVLLNFFLLLDAFLYFVIYLFAYLLKLDKKLIENCWFFLSLAGFCLILYISFPHQTILATIFGKRDAVICQAYGSVQVGVPTSASLIAQNDMLAIGREMPVFPSFYEARILKRILISVYLVITCQNINLWILSGWFIFYFWALQKLQVGYRRWKGRISVFYYFCCS